MSRYRYSMFAAALLAALLFSAFAAMPAYADDGTPPPGTEEPAPPVDSGGGEETPPPAEQSAPPVDSNGEQEAAPPVVEESAPPAAEDSPTPVIVVNEAGEVLPLASQEAAEVIANNDPMWCPAGVAPGGAGCTAVTSSFATMLTNLTGMYGATGPAKAGVIWIAAGYDSSVDDPLATNFTLDGGVLTAMSNYALTINGGWSGTGTTLNSADPSEFNVPFAILNWNAPITINNLLITGAGGMGYALDVGTTGNITINNTDVTGNTSSFGGANLDNDAGTGNVTVTNSSFSGNSGAFAYGLNVTTKGVITLKDVDASSNTVSGAWIDNTASATPKTVTLNGGNTFNSNGGNGLIVYSRGAVTLSNITAVGNQQNGVYVDNCVFNFVSGVCSLIGTAGAGVTLKGVNTFLSNGYDGLRVWSGGAIAASNLNAMNNGTNASRPASTQVDPDSIPASGDEYYTYDAYGKGVFLHNYGATTPKPITVSGSNVFKNNSSVGLFVYTKGLFVGSNITANFNACDNAYDLSSYYCAGMYVYSESGVKQTGYAAFYGNNREGLQIDNPIKGYVALSNLDAQSNGTGFQSGVEIYAYNAALAIPVTITGSNLFAGNNFNGLSVSASGAVSLSNATARDNVNGSGIWIDNSAPFKAPVVLLGQTLLTNNGADGLTINSYGAVTTNGIVSRLNFGIGAYINNCDNMGGACSAPAPAAVTLNGENTFVSNSSNNLYVTSRGAITVSNLTSQFSNTGYGAYLNNRYSNAAGGVTLKNFARVDSNNQTNILINSYGAVSATNVTANSSVNGYGMYIQNDAAAMPGVTLAGVNQFMRNAFNGLTVYSYGGIALSNVTASANGNPAFAYGAYLDNTGGASPKPITLTGINSFVGNFNAGGLLAYSYGAITVYNVVARNNGSTGVLLNNQYNLYVQPIIVAGYGVFESNGVSGLFAQSNGNVTMANLTANNNALYGAYVNASNNVSPSVSANVTLTGNNFFHGNTSASGLWVTNDGNITASNIAATSNGGYGAYLDNSALAGVGEVKTVTVNGINNFYFNTGIGLSVNSSGGANLARINAGSNYNPGAPMSDGLYVNAAGTLTLTCGKFQGNEGSGYNLNAAVIKLLGFLSSGNGAADFAAAGVISQTKVCPLP